MNVAPKEQACRQHLECTGKALRPLMAQTRAGRARKVNVLVNGHGSSVGEQVQVITAIHLQHKRPSDLGPSHGPGNGSQAEGSDHSHQSGRSLWSCDWPGSSLSAPTSAAPRRIPCWGLEDPAAEGGVSSHGSFPSSTLRAPERLSQAMGPSS